MATPEVLAERGQEMLLVDRLFYPEKWLLMRLRLSNADPRLGGPIGVQGITVVGVLGRLSVLQLNGRTEVESWYWQTWNEPDRMRSAEV